MARAFLVVLPDEIDIFGDGDMGNSSDWLFGTLQNELDTFVVREMTRSNLAFVNDAMADLEEQLQDEE